MLCSGTFRGQTFPWKRVDYTYLEGDYGKGKLMNQKIVWLPLWDKELGFKQFEASLLGSPQRCNQLEGPKNETQTERDKTIGEQNITDYDTETKEAVGRELTQTEEAIGEGDVTQG